MGLLRRPAPAPKVPTVTFTNDEISLLVLLAADQDPATYKDGDVRAVIEKARHATVLREQGRVVLHFLP